MALLNETYDAATLPQNTSSFDPLPKGWYSATIAGAELKTTKNGTGQYIAVRYDIIGPTHQGRVVFGNINIRNQNIKAEEIGRMDLGNLMRAIGLPSVQDTDQLISGRLQIKLAISTQEGYEPRNEVKGYKAISSSQPQASGTQQFASQQQVNKPAQQQAAASTPPWAQR